MCDEKSDWNPDIADIPRQDFAPHQGHRGHPEQPHGALYPGSLLREIVQVAREHG